MIKKVFKFAIIVLMIFGIVQGVKIAAKRAFPNLNLRKAEENLVEKMQSNNVDLLEFYTYGRALNIKGQIPRVKKDNIESVKLYITDGMDYEKSYNLEFHEEENNLVFESKLEMNNGIILDKLENDKQYYLLLRMKLNNSVNPKFYSFNNKGEYENIDYFTITKDGQNRLAKIEFINKSDKNGQYSFLGVKLEDSTLPEEIYDIVIDAGHGGSDVGEKRDGHTEADIALKYAYDLRDKLVDLGYKVKLTRDNENTNTYNYRNMYDSNGRISIACRTKAKLMISLHMNNSEGNATRGLEIYCPPNSNLTLAKRIANAIIDNSSMDYSNKSSLKQADGVYIRNYTKAEIASSAKNAEKKGYDPYPITEDTPFLYTIREVGGYATDAYVDGRNKDYSKNEYYHSNQGIECYEIDLGYMKNDLEIVLNERDKIVEAIAKAISENY